MPRLLGVERPLDRRHGVSGRHPDRLVEDDPAIDVALLGARLAKGFGDRRLVHSGSWILAAGRVATPGRDPSMPAGVETATAVLTGALTPRAEDPSSGTD
jgi:hypothetical protein